MTSPAVLIVEDDPNLREALLDTLRCGDHPAFAVSSGAEALDVLHAEDVGLVVSDLQMEPMDGHELLGEIRQQYPALPAVLMTAHGSIENAVDEIRSGAADYLVKPFEAETFRDMVTRYLRPGPVTDKLIAVDASSLRLLHIAERVAAERCHGNDQWRERQRQGGVCPTYSPAFAALRGAVCCDQLCSHSGQHAGSRVVRL